MKPPRLSFTVPSSALGAEPFPVGHVLLVKLPPFYLLRAESQKTTALAFRGAILRVAPGVEIPPFALQLTAEVSRSTFAVADFFREVGETLYDFSNDYFELRVVAVNGRAGLVMVEIPNLGIDLELATAPSPPVEVIPTTGWASRFVDPVAPFVFRDWKRTADE